MERNEEKKDTSESDKHLHFVMSLWWKPCVVSLRIAVRKYILNMKDEGRNNIKQQKKVIKGKK